MEKPTESHKPREIKLILSMTDKVTAEMEQFKKDYHIEMEKKYSKLYKHEVDKKSKELNKFVDELDVAETEPSSSYKPPCPVCMKPIKNIFSTLCGHVFCKSCIYAAIDASGICPICRKKVTKIQVHPVYL